MTQKQRTQAFILRAIPYKERDLMVTLLTPEHGRISALAKNARSSRRFGGGVQLFRKVDAMLQPKSSGDMFLFLEMEVTRDFPALESSYDKITIGSYGTELLRELTREGAESAALFELLEGFYAELETLGDDLQTLETVLHFFELRVLENFGAIPSLWHCQRCGLTHGDMERLHCTRTGEGLLCAGCRRPGEAVGTIERDSLSLLQHFDRPTPEVPDAWLLPEARQQARRVLNSSFQLILQRDLKSRAMLETVWN